MTPLHRPDAVVRAFLDDARMRGLSQKTIYNCQLTLRRVGDWAATSGRPPVLYLTTGDLLDWARSQRQILPQTLNGYLVQIRMFYAWAVTRQILDADPAERIELPKLPRRLPDPMPDDVFSRMLTVAEPDMRVILGLAGFMGLRACEIAWLPWSAVRFADMRVRVIGKGNKERVMPLKPIVAELLAGMPTRSGPVVPRRDGGRGHNEPHTISHRANAFLHDQDCPWTLHKLRHRAGTLAMAATGDALAVAEFLGHEGLSNVQVYAKVSATHLDAAADAAARLAS